MALKKICPTCGRIIEYDMCRCKECNDVYKNRYKKYKANRTDKKEQKFYVSMQWNRIRQVIKQRDKGLCKICLSKGNITYMNTVHHIEELKECWDKRLDPSNLISVCESCHQLVHEGYKNNKLDIQNKLKKLIEG